MESLSFKDPLTGNYEPVYAPCRCGAVLTAYEIETFGTCCESCANHYHEEQQMANLLND